MEIDKSKKDNTNSIQKKDISIEIQTIFDNNRINDLHP
jgi:hypothetical protein